MFKSTTCGCLLISAILFVTASALQADEPTLCDLLKKEQQLLKEYFESRTLHVESQASGRSQSIVDDLHEARTENYAQWQSAVYEIQELIRGDEEVQQLIRAYKEASDEWERREIEYVVAKDARDRHPSSDLAQKTLDAKVEQASEAYQAMVDAERALRENDLGYLWYYLERKMDYFYDQLVGWSLNEYEEALLTDPDGDHDHAWKMFEKMHDALANRESDAFERICKQKWTFTPVGNLAVRTFSPNVEPGVFWIGTGGATGNLDARGLVGLNPQPDPPSIAVRGFIGLNPQPDPPSIPALITALADLPAPERAQTFAEASGWAEKSDSRVIRHAQLRAQSVAAVLAEMSLRGKVNGDESWVPFAQQALKQALGAQTPPADRAAKELQSLNRLATFGAITHLDAVGLVPLKLLSSQPKPKQQSGIQFAKVTARADKGQSVPGATMVFKITKQTPDGPRMTTEIAKTNDKGEVDLLPPEDPQAKDEPGDSTIVVGPEDTIDVVVVTGKTSELPVSYQAGKMDKSDPGNSPGMVVQVEPQPEHKVAFAMTNVQPENAPAEGENPDAEKMQTLEQALIQALLKIIGAADAKTVPSAGQTTQPSYRAGLASSSQDAQGAWTMQTVARQSGVSIDPQPEDPGRRIDPQPEDPGRRKPFVAWTFPVPQFQTPNGKPLAVTVEQMQQAVAQVSKMDNVMLAEVARPRNAEALPDDPYFSSRGSWGQRHMDQWALQRVGFTPPETSESAWPKDLAVNRYLYKPVTVAVIGSGVDYTHPDLITRMWVNRRERLNGRDDDGNGYVDDVFGWNFRDNSRDVMDYGGHDTHVAGLIAAEWNNGYGIAGINPMARIMALKVADLFGKSDSAAISQAIYYAVDHGARVINVSYSGGDLSEAEQLAIDYAVDKGVLVVAAAGNQATDNSGHGIAGAVGVLTVAATAVEGDRAAFSNWGQAVEIAAPGLDILSLRARDSDFLLHVGENPNYQAGSAVVGKEQDLYRAGGTSFAAPLVAGTASLIWSFEPGLSLDQVRRKLLISAEDIDTSGWDQTTGAGLLDAKKAIAADPDHYLITRITKVAPGPPDGDTPRVAVDGIAVGTELKGVWLQIGFGEEPAKDEWQTVYFSKDPVSGPIHLIPLTKFARLGVWTIRLLAQDSQDLVRQSRARLDLE